MISVAIDGPAGAGKSTIARAAAKALGCLYVDTGALYRAIGLKFLRNGVAETSDCEIEPLLRDTEVTLRFVQGEQRVFLDGEDVSEAIRTPAVSKMASAVSAKPPVRAFLLAMQRRLAEESDVLMDGRDIGTVVLPNATVKIFLTASVAARAKRRYDELCEKGIETSLEEVCRDIEQRDYNDSHRAIAPLKQAEDAILLDTTDLDREQSLAALLAIVREETACK